jgi:phage-related protein
MAGKMKIGAGLALDGEREFKQAISGINKDLSVLGSEMGKVTAQFGSNANSMDALKAKSEVYNKQIDEQKKKIETLKAALENSAKEFGENDNKTKNWQIALNKAEADLAKTENKLKDTTDKMDRFGNEADNTGKEVEKAGKKAKDSGNDAEKGESGWSKLGSGLAQAGKAAGVAVTALGAAATAAGTALVGTSVSGAKYADEMLTMAQTTGLTTEQVQEFKYMQELVDVPLETMTKSLARNVKSMGDAARGSKTAVEAYQKLGVGFQNTDGSLRDANDVYFETLEALGEMGNEAERDALAMQLFGRSARDLVPMIEAGADELNAMKKEAHDMGYVLESETLGAFGAFDDELQRLKVGSEGAKNALGTLLLPALTTLAGDGVDLLGQFTNGINNANGDIGKMVDVVAQTLNGVVSKIIEYLPQLIESGMQIISTLGQGILDNLPMIIDSAIQIITTLSMGLLEALPQIVDGALQIIIALASGIGQFLPELIPAIVDTVMTIVDTLIDNIDMLIDASIAIIMALADGLIEALPRLINKIPTIIDKLINAITNNLPKLLEAGITIIVKLAEGLIKAIPSLLKAIPTIIVSIVNGFATYISKIWDIGKNIVRGIWDGIKAMGQWIKDKVSGFFSGVVDSVKGLLGIHSPSKVFAGIGENMALGLGEGFSTEMDGIGKKINNSIPTSFDVTGNYNIAGSKAKQSAINITPVIMLDGKVITKSTSRIQSQVNNGKFRALGAMA